MTTAAPTVGYILKRYPRLSETFILNEMRALERLDTPLHIFSLLQPDDAPRHPTVSEVRATVTYFPPAWPQAVFAVAKSHAVVAAQAPLRYLHATGLALWWSIRTRRPWSVGKQFLRSGYVAHGCLQHNIQHLHAHFANAPATVARLAGVMCNIPHSFTTISKDLYLTPPKVMRRRIESAHFVLTCTHYNVEYLRGFLPRQDWDKIHLIYHGIDLSAFPQDETFAGAPSGEDADLPLILSVGRLVPKKGMRDLLNACHLLHHRGVAFRCIIVGEGPLRQELEAHIAELGLTAVVTLPGAMAHDRLLAFYRRATLFALAPQVTEDGDRDGIPNVLAEAMAAGTPVVSTSVSGIPELIEDGRTGLLVPPQDPAALAAALERVLSEAPLRHRFAAASRAKIEERFECWETAKALRTLFVQSVQP